MDNKNNMENKCKATEISGGYKIFSESIKINNQQKIKLQMEFQQLKEKYSH